MATWTLRHTLSSGSGYPNPTWDDSDKIYWGEIFGSYPDVYQYSRSGGTATRISNQTTTFGTGRRFKGNLADSSALVYFDGELYCVVYGGTPGITVWQYDGSGTSWTKVLDATGSGSTWNANLMTDGTTMVLFTQDPNADNKLVHYTTDGTSWSSGTFTLTPTPPTGSYNIFRDYCRLYTSPLGIYMHYYQQYFTNRWAWHIMEFSGGAFATQWYYDYDSSGPTYRGNSRVEYWKFADKAHWYSYSTIDYSLDFSSWTTPSTALSPIQGFGFSDFDVGYDGSSDQDLYTINPGDGDSDWTALETIRSGAGIVKAVVRFSSDGVPFAFTGSGSGGGAQYYLYERSDGISEGADELRLIDMAADNTNLYLTANEGGTLKLLTVSLDNLTRDNALSAGAATYADLDSRTKGIFPVIKPGEDIIFVRGRDGNDVHVQYSDDYGVSLNDIDDGGWAAGKYAVALMPDPLNPDDIIVAFDDNDIYQTTDGGSNWSKIDDAPIDLREAARGRIENKNLILAGQSAGAGELFFSPNLGDTTEDVSDAGLDIIDHIEQSL